MSSYETIRYSVSGGIARLTLDRPDQRNGMTKRMVRETHTALTEAAADPSLRVLLLTGEGTSFCPAGVGSPRGTLA